MKSINRKEFPRIRLDGKSDEKTAEAVLSGLRKLFTQTHFTITDVWEEENELHVISSYEDATYILKVSTIYDKSKRCTCLKFECRTKVMADSDESVIMVTDFRSDDKYFYTAHLRLYIKVYIQIAIAHLDDKTNPNYEELTSMDFLRSAIDRFRFLFTKPN